MNKLQNYVTALNRIWRLFKERWETMPTPATENYWDETLTAFSNMAREYEGKPEHAFVSDFCVACLSQLQRRARGLINEN